MQSSRTLSAAAFVTPLARDRTALWGSRQPGSERWKRSASCAAASLGQLHRLEVRWQDDLQHFSVVRIVEHLVLDARRLDPGAAGTHHVRTLAFELGLDPALEHIDHLKFDVVIVQLGDFLRPAWRHEAD